MPNFDDLLTRELERAAHPAAPDLGHVEKEVRRRRARRGVIRRVQAGVLTVAVLAATAGGFVLLQHAFRGDRREAIDIPAPAALPSNGKIAYTVRTSAGSEHIYIVEPDGTGSRQITRGEGVTDKLPDWSPDGNRIVFVRIGEKENTIRLVVADVGSGSTEAITPPSMGVYRPAWSPDGNLIAFAGVGEEVSGIWVVRPDGSDLRRLTDDRFFAPDAPQWSHDGSTIAFASNLAEGEGGYREGWDVYLVGVDGSGLRNLTNTADPESSEGPIGWLPNGNLLIAQSPEDVRSGLVEPTQTGRWLEITPAGDVVRSLIEDPVNTVEHLQQPSLSPDGRFVVFDSGRDGLQNIWFLELATAEFTQVTKQGGYGADWQPILSPQAEQTVAPSPSEEPTPDGRDIGLEFRVCDVETLGGIALIGGGPAGRAWTGVPVKGDGTCPQSSFGKVILAVDHTGDGLADSWWGPIEGCDFCRPLGATDLDEDGIDEIVVQNGFSIADHWIFRVPLDEGAAPKVEPILVAPPGHEPAGLLSGEPLVLGVGGDAGYSGYLRCETYPESPILVYTWIFAEVDANSDQEVHETRLSLGDDGRFHVVDTNDFTVPRGDDIPLELSTARACGVDWRLFP